MTIDHAVSRYAQDAPVVPLDDGKDLAGVLSRISPSPHVSPAAVSPRPNPRRFEAKDIDWRTVVSFRRKASERISSERASHRERTGVDLSGDDVRMLGRSIVRQAVESHAEKLTAEGKPCGARRLKTRTSARSWMPSLGTGGYSLFSKSKTRRILKSMAATGSLCSTGMDDANLAP